MEPAWLQPAFALLRRSRSRAAAQTLRAISSGRARVRSLHALTASDLRHVRRDLRSWDLRIPSSLPRALRMLSRSITGYTWSDRVYVHPALPARALAATLVHEVSHVLHNSQAHYRTARDVLREEYRAYYAEKRFEGVPMTRERCRALKERVIREYRLAGVTAADVPDSPRSRASRARR